MRRCLEVEEYGEIRELAADDERVHHVEECARCRSGLAAYERFLDFPDDAARADVAWAAKRMDQRLRGEIRGRSEPRLVLPRPLFRWGLAAAATVVAVFAGTALVERMRDRGEALLRGEPDSPGAESSVPGGLLAAAAEGGVGLTWTPVGRADAYRVELFRADLSPAASLGPTTEPRLLLRPSDLPSDLPSGTWLLWRVEALHRGDPIGLSAVASVQAP